MTGNLAITGTAVTSFITSTIDTEGNTFTVGSSTVVPSNQPTLTAVGTGGTITNLSGATDPVTPVNVYGTIQIGAGTALAINKDAHVNLYGGTVAVLANMTGTGSLTVGNSGYYPTGQCPTIIMTSNTVSGTGYNSAMSITGPGLSGTQNLATVTIYGTLKETNSSYVSLTGYSTLNVNGFGSAQTLSTGDNNFSTASIGVMSGSALVVNKSTTDGNKQTVKFNYGTYVSTGSSLSIQLGATPTSGFPTFSGLWAGTYIAGALNMTNAGGSSVGTVHGGGGLTLASTSTSTEYLDSDFDGVDWQDTINVLTCNSATINYQFPGTPPYNGSKLWQQNFFTGGTVTLTGTQVFEINGQTPGSMGWPGGTNWDTSLTSYGGDYIFQF